MDGLVPIQFNAKDQSESLLTISLVPAELTIQTI